MGQTPLQKLPEAWEWIKLKDAFEIRRGTVDPQRFPDEYFTLYSIPAYDSNRQPEVVLGKDVGSSKVKVEKGDILFSKLNPRIPRIWLTDDESFRPRIASTEFLPLVQKKDNSGGDFFVEEFICWLLRAILFRAQISHQVQGATNSRQRLSIDAVKNAFLPRPCSLEVQKSIASRINLFIPEIKEAIRLLNVMRKSADVLLSTTVHEILSGTAKKNTYRTVPLREVATAFNGRASGEGSSNVRVFKTKHVYPHTLRLDRPSFMKAEQANKMPVDRFLQPADVLMANIAEGTLGRVSYVDQCEDNWTVDTQIMILRSLDQKNVLLGKWLYYYLWSDQGQKEILSRRSGIAFADKRGQTHIYPKNVLEIPVPVPSMDKQREAVAYLDTIQKNVDEVRNQIMEKEELFNQLEQSILGRAFRGEL